MEMRTSEDVCIGQDVNSPLSPLATALYDSFLLSHCSSCFSSLLPPYFSSNSHHVLSLLYCSTRCSAAASSLHSSSAEHNLLLLRPHHLPICYADDTSDLRAALRLLHLFQTLRLPLSGDRVGGLLTNRESLFSHRNLDPADGNEVMERIREGGKAMARARSFRDSLESYSAELGLEEEEMALCIVLANAVEVRSEGGRGLGIAVYDTTFSWINHSCSPNTCYRFLMSLPQTEMLHFSGDLGLRISPGGRDIVNSFFIYGELRKGWEKYGPRIVVRSIKPIKKGEEVTVAYIDLLQTKAMRHSELWRKYRFICSCRRCSGLPSTYVDNVLQDIAATNVDHYTLSLNFNFRRDEAVKILSDHIDDAISEYLLASDPKSCCRKLENILTQGIFYEQLEPNKGKLMLNLRLHPLHHLALNAYTTLASAYKTYAGNLLALQPKNNDRKLDAFNMSRTSAAYSLFLAGAAHHLFLSESSLIASVANFWTNAGESLLCLARNSFWNLFVKCDSSLSDHDRCKCLLMDRFGTNLAFIQAEYSYFEDITREFLDCIAKIIPEVWGFLAYDCHYLEPFKDPTDFSWLGEAADDQNSWQLSGGNASFRVSSCGRHGYSNRERGNLFKLGFHCLIYGGYLLSICYGSHSYWISNVQSIMCSG